MRRVVWHVRRVGGQLDRRFFLTLAEGIVGFVAVAAILITLLEKPWTFTYALKRMPDYTLLEYVCEDNREYADDKGIQRIRIDSPAR